MIEEGEITAQNCRFEGSTDLSIAIRNQSNGSFKNCQFIKTKRQGLAINASVVKMEKCEVIGCGALPYASGILVEGGQVRMVGCKVERNKGDGVVVQGEGGKIGVEEGELVMEGCEVRGNGMRGVSMATGNLVMEGCEVRKNEKTGVEVILGRGNITDSIIIADAGLGRRGVVLGNAPSSLIRSKVSSLSLYNRENVCLLDSDIGTIESISKGFAPLYEPSPLFYLPSLKRDHLSSRKEDVAQSTAGFRFSMSPKPFIYPPRITPDNQLQPMTIMGEWREREREVGRRSVGKVLMGRVCCPPQLYVSVMTVLEDEEGSGVFVAIYNLPGTVKFGLIHFI